MILLNVIRVIDSAAKSIPVPELKICFDGGLKTEKCRSNERKEISVLIENVGEAIGEDLVAFIQFRPEFKVHPSREYEIVKQGIPSDYPGYNAVVSKTPSMHVGMCGVLKIRLTMPEKEDAYKVPVVIYERKIGKVEDKLVIETIPQTSS